MTDLHYWSKKVKLYDNMHLMGFSVAAKRTCFYIPEFKIMLDCGVPSDFNPNNIFITHGHADHSFQLPLLLSNVETKPNIFVIDSKKTDFYNLIHYSFVLNNNKIKSDIHKKYSLIPCSINEDITLNISNSQWKIKIFECFHSVPCIGFGFSQIRKKIKPEFVFFTQAQIIALKKEKINITYDSVKYLFCYLGDTSCEIIENPDILHYKYIIMECTFLDMNDLDKSISDKHIHFSQIEEFIRINKTNTFILYHFSAKYRNDYILDFFKEKNIDNIIPWT